MMRVPLTWLNEYVPLNDSPQVAAANTSGAELAARVAADLVRVGLEEEAIHSGDVTGPLVVGRVVDVVAEPQRNGKTINWCRVDVGPEHAEEGGGPRGIVCGAGNFGVGDLVVVALPGAALPGGFAISSRKTYGHRSDGMICSVAELGLGKDHSGIIVLTELLGAPVAAELKPGDNALPVLGLDQHTVEVNVTPDRGYCFSVRGIAREYASATDRPEAFADPARVQTPKATVDGFRVRLDDDAPIHGVPGCDRFVTRIVRGVNPDAPTPAWLRQRVEQAGMRPISLIVDVTNYLMLGLGQPMHAYDLDTVTEPITVRRSRPHERLVTLDGVDRALHHEDLLITDAASGGPGSRVIGLAGVMGGLDSEISAATRDVLLEAAHFDPVSISRTARRHRLGSEASKRFERAVDPQLPPAAAELAVQLLVTYGGGTASERVGDVDDVPARDPITIDPQHPTRLIGVQISDESVARRLREVGCAVEVGDTEKEPEGRLMVTPPSWRPDLAAPADLVEEVARLEGYEKIPPILPTAPAGGGLTRSQRSRRVALNTLADLGFDEVLSYPFVSSALFDDLGYEAADPRRRAVRLTNPLSDEAPLLRTSVLSTLVGVLRRNLARGADDVRLVELGSVSHPRPDASPARILPVTKRPSADDLAALVDAVPLQPTHVAGIACGQADLAGWWGTGRPVDASDAIGAVSAVLRRLGVPGSVRAAQQAPWHPGRCAGFAHREVDLGFAGEMHPRICERLGLPARTVAFEMNLDAVLAVMPDRTVATPVSPHPVVKEDLALVVDHAVPAGQVAAALVEAGGELLESVRLFDVYSGPQVGDGRRSLAFSLRMRAPDRTLTSAEARQVRDSVVQAAATRFGAVLRGAG